MEAGDNEIVEKRKQQSNLARKAPFMDKMTGQVAGSTFPCPIFRGQKGHPCLVPYLEMELMAKFTVEIDS